MGLVEHFTLQKRPIKGVGNFSNMYIFVIHDCCLSPNEMHLYSKLRLLHFCLIQSTLFLHRNKLLQLNLHPKRSYYQNS